MTTTMALAITLALVTAGTAGWAITCSRLRRRIRELEQECACLQADIDARMNRWQESEALKRQFAEQFHQFSNQTLAGDRRPLPQSAEHTLKPYRGSPKPALSKREQTVESLIEPLREQLEKTDQQLCRSEVERRAAYASLAQHLRRTWRGWART